MFHRFRGSAFAVLCASVFVVMPVRAQLVRLACDNDRADIHDTYDIDLAGKTVLKVYANGKTERYEISQITDRFVVFRGDWSRFHTDPLRLTGVQYRLDRAVGMLSWVYIETDGSPLGSGLN